MAELYNVVCRVAVKWESIGVQLKLSVGDLEQIRHDHAGVKLRCLAVVRTWQNKVYPEYTWKTFIKVLLQESVSEQSLAMDLKAELLAKRNSYQLEP